MKDRDRIGFSDTSKGFDGCGFSDISFGTDERYLFLYALERTAREANIKLKRIMDRHNLAPVPLSLDRVKVNFLMNKLNIISKGCNAVTQISCPLNDIEIKDVKRKVNENIQGIERWGRKYSKIMGEIKLYEKKPNDELKASILDSCLNLNIIIEPKK